MRKVYKIMFFVSMALTMAAIIITAVFGLRFGVDFKGGALMEIVFKENRPPTAELSETIGAISGAKDINISPVGDRGALIRLNSVDEQTHQNILNKISEKFGEINESRFDSIGPTIGKELRSRSITAIIILLAAIISYIAFVFRKMSRVLSPWAMGLAAVIALIHDVVIPVGVFALLGHYYGIEITAVFVAAALTILGYSLSDSVVVFDRVRENVLRFGATAIPRRRAQTSYSAHGVAEPSTISQDFGELVHKSIMQTLVRSLNTTFTTLLALIAIFFFGGESIKYFALALIIGIFSGAYSSIFVASPLLVWLSGRRS
ncbi:MAG: protein translocase subunit SecF [Candidatus Azambacteria bacterium]|nr:protein translocase subunit SecF [Candidatus Azambacteria bacterium]